MLSGVEMISGLTAGLAGAGALEFFQLARERKKVPVRIHVNGTRGKSSVTRLIAAGLRESGLVTYAKTTGTLPRFVLADGSEEPIDRLSAPNVIEQVRQFIRAARLGAHAVVFECMALHPFLQWLTEEKMLRATHTVITNVRPDHLDVMGPTEEDIARALAGSIGRGAKVFTAEEKYSSIFERVARQRGAQVMAIRSGDVQAVTPKEMAGFSYEEHAENVALSLCVCADLGVARQTALAGMWKAKPDPGAMTIDDLEFFGRHITFVNAFAANDPASTRMIWENTAKRYADAQTRIALVNCREDRPERSQQFAAFCAEIPQLDQIVVVGSGISVFSRAAKAVKIDRRKLTLLAERTVPEIFEIVVERAGRSALVVGMGNIGGIGLDLARFFRNRSALPEVA